MGFPSSLTLLGIFISFSHCIFMLLMSITPLTYNNFIIKQLKAQSFSRISFHKGRLTLDIVHYFNSILSHWLVLIKTS